MKDETWNLIVVGVGAVLIISAFWVGRLTAYKTMQSPIYYQSCDNLATYQRGWIRGWFVGSGHDEGGQ